jgi:clan AA aspartic protease (TIGR02281 family)
MKKAAFLLIFCFVLSPVARASANSNQEMELIYKRNMGKAPEDWDYKVIKVAPDGTGHLLVDVVLNREVHALLTLDTGAPVVCLTANIARKLGFDLDKMKNLEEVMLLNGKHKVANVYLKSVDLGGAEQENVPAVLFLEDDKSLAGAFKDGLLGLSFLKKFNFTLDDKNSELILRKK